MNRLLLSGAIAMLYWLGAMAAPAHAQVARAFVSAANGNDGGNTTCDRATPCRTFQHAHNAVFESGEITVLDPGGYGAVTINRSISIINDGVGESSILVSGGNTGVTINSAAKFVFLRGITIQGIGFGGGTGLRFNGGTALTLSNCVIRSHTGNGVEFLPNTASSLVVSNSLVGDNGGTGIAVHPTGGVAVNVVLNRVELYGNTADGLFVDNVANGNGTLTAEVVDSVAANNVNYGFATDGAARLTVIHSASLNNNTGVAKFGFGSVRIGHSTLAGNVASWFGSVESFGDNYITGNGDGDPAPPTIARK